MRTILSFLGGDRFFRAPLRKGKPPQPRRRPLVSLGVQAVQANTFAFAFTHSLTVRQATRMKGVPIVSGRYRR